VVAISSVAALRGSPLSGRYPGAKAMIRFGDQVRQPVVLGALEGCVQVGCLGGEYLDRLVDVAVGSCPRDVVITSQSGRVGAVAEPSQDQNGLPEAGQRPAVLGCLQGFLAGLGLERREGVAVLAVSAHEHSEAHRDLTAIRQRTMQKYRAIKALNHIGGLMASKLGRALAVLGCTAALAAAAVAPAQAATDSVRAPAGQTLAQASSPAATTSPYTYGPYSTQLACDNQWASIYGSPNVASITYCTPTWQGWYFKVSYYIVTTY
jgi:hypothetical protein